MRKYGKEQKSGSSSRSGLHMLVGAATMMQKGWLRVCDRVCCAVSCTVRVAFREEVAP